MTKLGKILVCSTLVLAIGMAAWALGLYVSQRPGEVADAGPAAKGPAKKGNRAQLDVFEREARLKALQKSLDEAAARWEPPHARLVARQPDYYIYPPWYELQLADLETSKGNLQAVQYLGGLIVLDPKEYGRPVMEQAAYPPLTPQDRQQRKAGEPLKSSTFYRQKTEEERLAFQKASQDVAKLYAEDEKLTNELAGDPAKAGEPGLWVRLANEQHKIHQLVAEAEDLRDIWTKIQVDYALLFRRLEQMQERQAELQGMLGVKTARP